MAPPAVDAKAKADVKVDVPPPPPAPEPKPEAKAEVKPDAKAAEGSSVPIDFNYKSVFIAPEVGIVGRGFQNSGDDNTHWGAFGGFRLGFPQLSIGNRFYARILDFTFRHESVKKTYEAEYGANKESSATIDSLLFGPTIGVNIWKYIGAELSGEFGPSHIGATSEDNGQKGLRYHDNRFLYSADNWGFSYGGRLALTVPEQRVASWMTLGGSIFGILGKSNWQLVPDSISRPPSDPEIPVGSTYGGVGISIGGHFGEAPKIYPSTTSTTAEEPKVEDKGAAAPAPAPAPAPAVPAGVKAIQDMVEPMKTDVAKVMTTEPAKNAAGYAQIATDGVKQKKVDKSMVKDATDSAVGEYRRAAAGYKAATEKVAQADAALAELKKDTTLKPEQIKLAEEAVAAMKAEADKLKEETGKAYKSASDAVKAYNGIKGLPKKEKIEFTDKDPTAPAEAAKPAKPKPDPGAVK